MKIIMKEIEMIAYFECEGTPTPLKYRIEGEEGKHVVSVEKILWHQEDKRAGNRMLTYLCQSNFCGVMRQYELRYETQSLKWFLYKM